MTQDQKEEAVIPDEIKDFVELLKDHEVKEAKAISIGKFISRTGSPEVFEKPEELADFLARYPRDLAPVQRRRILEQWFAEKGVSVPEDLLTKTAMHPKEVGKAEKDREKAKKKTEGEVWTVDIDDKGMPRIRMIKDIDEPGTTLEAATKAAKEIGKEYGGEESLVIYNENLGRHMPNFKSDFVKKNLAVAWAAASQMDKAMAEGITVDPMETFVEQMAKIESMKEIVGAGKKEPESIGTIGEIVIAIKALRDLEGGGKGGGFLDSVDDLIKLKTLLGTDEDSKNLLAGIYKRLTESGEGKGESEDVKGLREDVKSLREELQKKERERVEERITSLNTTISEVRADLARVRSESRATDEYGIMGEAIKVVDRRLGALEGMARGVFGKAPGLLPSGVKKELTQAISKEAVEGQALDELAEKVFYS